MAFKFFHGTESSVIIHETNTRLPKQVSRDNDEHPKGSLTSNEILSGYFHEKWGTIGFENLRLKRHHQITKRDNLINGLCQSCGDDGYLVNAFIDISNEHQTSRSDNPPKRQLFPAEPGFRHVNE